MQKSFKSLIFQCFAFMILLYALNLGLRGIFICFFTSEISGVNLGEFVQFFANAARYDGQIIGVLSVIFFVLNLFNLQKILKIYAFLLIIFTTFVSLANVGFYALYKDVFNAILLGLVFDDKKAIFETAFSGDFGFMKNVILWLFVSVIFCVIFAYLYQKLAHIKKAKFTLNLAYFLAFSLICLFAINGKIGLKGISLGQQIIPVENAFLRKITHGAWRDLNYVRHSYQKIANSSLKDYTNEDALGLTRHFFGLNDENSSYDLGTLLQKSVSNPLENKIEHIFYIIAESYSEWSFASDFKELNLSTEMQKLIENGAFKAEIFLQNAPSTRKSLDSQIAGLYQSEISLSLSVGQNPIFRMSPGFIFKDLGYHLRFYYGGSGTWYKLDNYTLSQGFDEILYNSHIVEFATQNAFTPPFENAWGAFDHYLYDFIKTKTIADKGKKTFNMIMTTSNHAPWDIEVEKFGVEYDKIDKFLAAHPQIAQNDSTRRVLAHAIYQDKIIAKFIRETSKALPNSLFIITGDHMSAGFSHPAKGDVPLIVFSPILKPKILAKIGSHIDIVPTIAELVAPNAYKYISFGSPMLSNDHKKPFNADKIALGYDKIATSRFIYRDKTLDYIEPKREFNSDKSLAQGIYEQLNRAKALSWWVFRKGYIIK